MIVAIIVGAVCVIACAVYGARRYELVIPVPTASARPGSAIFMIGVPGGILGWLAATFFWHLAARFFGSSMPFINSIVGIVIYLVAGVILGFFFAATQINPLQWAKVLKEANIIADDQERQCALQLDRQMTRATLWWNLSLGVLWLVWFIVVAPRLPCEWYFATPLPVLFVVLLLIAIVQRCILVHQGVETHRELGQAISAAAAHVAKTPNSCSIITANNVLESLVPGSTSFQQETRYKVFNYRNESR